LERRSEFVFPNYSGTQLHRQYLSRRFKHFVREAKLPEVINFHSTRHTAASWLAERGASIEAIRLYLGHSSVRVTERYMHLAPDAYANEIHAALSA
jgi:site-specific recombinase XerD